MAEQARPGTPVAGSPSPWLRAVIACLLLAAVWPRPAATEPVPAEPRQFAQAQLPPSRITPNCARTITPFAFGDPDGFQRFIRECYLGQDQALDFQVIAVGWISPFPNPFNGKDTGLAGNLWGQAQGATTPKVLQPNWIPQVYMGLVATANETPPTRLSEPAQLLKRRQFRSMLGARFRLVMNPNSGEPIGATITGVVIDGGWTPPFSFARFLAPGAATLIPILNSQPDIQELKNTDWHRGYKSMISAVRNQRHPNSALTLPPGERLLVDALIRFRAGDETDYTGTVIGSPYHVPWVWNEFAVTYGSGRVNVYGIASAFPTTWWYVNGNRIMCQPRLDDSEWPLKSWSFEIDTQRLRAYPALSTGASAKGNAPQIPDDQPQGPVYQQPYTVGPPSGGGGGQWHYVVGDPPLSFPAVPACGNG